MWDHLLLDELVWYEFVWGELVAERVGVAELVQNQFNWCGTRWY